MSTFFLRLRGAVLALVLSVTSAVAGADDYRFELISTDHRVGFGAVLDLRLTDLRSGQPVEGAVIYATRIVS